MHAANWHPLTWLSRARCGAFRNRPSPICRDLVLPRFERSVVVWVPLAEVTVGCGEAFIAAVSPLRVSCGIGGMDSRRDCLSTFFGWQPCGPTLHPTAKLNNYLIVMLFLCLGLLAKPNTVTLRARVLLDFWPLQRVQFAGGGGGNIWRVRRDMLRLVAEKIPLIVLAVASCSDFGRGGMRPRGTNRAPGHWRRLGI